MATDPYANYRQNYAIYVTAAKNGQYGMPKHTPVSFDTYRSYVDQRMAQGYGSSIQDLWSGIWNAEGGALDPYANYRDNYNYYVTAAKNGQYGMPKHTPVSFEDYVKYVDERMAQGYGDSIQNMWNGIWNMNTPAPQPAPEPTPTPTPTPQPDPYLEEIRRQQEEERRRLEEELRRQQEEAARRQQEIEEAKRKEEEARQARMSDRKGALEQSGLWGVVEQLYGKNQSDIDNYLDTGVFSRRDSLGEWANSNLIPLSQDLQEQYAKGISDIQQRAAAQGMGDATWLRAVEGALRQQQRALADNYGTTYDPNRLYALLSGSPGVIRDYTYSAPQKVSDFGKGITGFTMLDPTLSQMVPGGIDETPMPWLKSDYQKKNPWAEIFGDTSETSMYNPAQGFLKGILGG